MARPTSSNIRRLARERLGFDDLRPGQEEAVRALTSGRDTLVVMTTGSGKSAIYQLAGWGPGVVRRYDGDRMTVLFETAGYKTLSVELVVERDLLTTSS